MVYLISWLRDLLSGTETGIQPGVAGLQDIFQSFLGGISLAGAMLEIRDISHKTRILFAPENIDMIVRDVHEVRLQN